MLQLLFYTLLILSKICFLNMTVTALQWPSVAVNEDFVCFYASLSSLKFTLTSGCPANCNLKASVRFPYIVNGSTELNGWKKT